MPHRRGPVSPGLGLAPCCAGVRGWCEGLVAVAGVVAAGSLAVAAVTGAAPATGVAAGAVQEEPAAARPVTSAEQGQLRGLQQVQHLEREQPRDVGELAGRELPAHRRPDQLAVGERVEQQGTQARRRHDNAGEFAVIQE
jgi:hypothetical protein